MRAARAAFLVLALAAAAPSAAQDPGLRLEMLAERIGKLHAQAGQGVLVERSRRALPEAMREFDASLRAAAAGAATPEARDNYILLRLLWRDYRAWAAKPPTRDNAARLAERTEEVAWIAAKGARLQGDSGRRGTGRLALEAEHAAMLSQRLARLLLLARWAMRDAAARQASAAASAELRQALERLRAAPANTPEIDTELQVAQGQLEFLAQAAGDLAPGRREARGAEFVAKASDHILESLERAARLYEGLPAAAR